MSTLLFEPFVEETTTTQGTGTLSLAGATSGRRSFVAAFGGGVICYYMLTWNAQWEYGVGIVTDASPDTLSRDLVLGSSAGGTKLSLGVGTKTVYCEAAPECALNAGFKTFIDGDTSPSVKNGHIFVAQNTSATTITQFDDGTPGQHITIVAGNGNTTLFAGSVLRHPAALNITMGTTDVVTYVMGSSVVNLWNLLKYSDNV